MIATYVDVQKKVRKKMTYKEFKALSDAYWLGWNNAQGISDKDAVSHRNFLTLIQNIMMDEMRLKEKEKEDEQIH